MLAMIALALSTTTALATYQADFAYDYVFNGGNNYTFNLTITNTSTGSDTGALDFFSIDFDADADWSSYSNISWTDNQGWYSEAVDYNAAFGALPGNVLADDSFMGSNGGGIAQGAALTFQFSFDYTGIVDPDAQLFSWIASFGTFDDNQGGYGTLGDAAGNLRYEGGGAPVPEPATLILFGTGLVGVAVAGRKNFLRK